MNKTNKSKIESEKEPQSEKEFLAHFFSHSQLPFTSNQQTNEPTNLDDNDVIMGYY